MLLALRLLYEQVTERILFPVIGGARKRKLRPPVKPFFSEKAAVELKGIALHSSAGELYVTASARLLLSSATAKFDLGIFGIEASATIPIKGRELKIKNSAEPDFCFVTLGVRAEYSDDVEAAMLLFLSNS